LSIEKWVVVSWQWAVSSEKCRPQTAKRRAQGVRRKTQSEKGKTLRAERITAQIKAVFVMAFIYVLANVVFLDSLTRGYSNMTLKAPFNSTFTPLGPYLHGKYLKNP